MDGARAVAGDVLLAHPALAWRVIVVWVPMMPTDDAAAAEEAASILDDARVVQFWDAERATARWFHDRAVRAIPELADLRVYRFGITWDTFLLYGADATWDASPSAPLVCGATVVAAFARLRAAAAGR